LKANMQKDMKLRPSVGSWVLSACDFVVHPVQGHSSSESVGRVRYKKKTPDSVKLFALSHPRIHPWRIILGFSANNPPYPQMADEMDKRPIQVISNRTFKFSECAFCAICSSLFYSQRLEKENVPLI